MSTLIDRLGGQRNAGIAAAGLGGVVVLVVGWRHSKSKAQQAATAGQQAQQAANAGYGQPYDPTQVYAGYDQLQQQIDQIRGTSGAGNPNPAPVPPPVATGGSTPPAPTPSGPPPSPTPKPAPAPTPAKKTYVVKSGDSLWSIAQRLYGNGSDWTKLYANNKAVVGSNPNLIRPGEKLTY